MLVKEALEDFLSVSAGEPDKLQKSKTILLSNLRVLLAEQDLMDESEREDLEHLFEKLTSLDGFVKDEQSRLISVVGELKGNELEELGFTKFLQEHEEEFSNFPKRIIPIEQILLGIDSDITDKLLGKIRKIKEQKELKEVDEISREVRSFFIDIGQQTIKMDKKHNSKKAKSTGGTQEHTPVIESFLESLKQGLKPENFVRSFFKVSDMRVVLAQHLQMLRDYSIKNNLFTGKKEIRKFDTQFDELFTKVCKFNHNERKQLVKFMQQQRDKTATSPKAIDPVEEFIKSKLSSYKSHKVERIMQDEHTPSM